MIIISICESAKNEVVEDEEEQKTSSSKLIVAIFQHFFQFKSNIRIYFWLWFSGYFTTLRQHRDSIHAKRKNTAPQITFNNQQYHLNDI